MKPITIGVSEDHTIYRNGLISMLNNKSGFSVVIAAENGKELTSQMKYVLPDVVILDYLTPEMNGIQTTKKIKKLYPNVKILILSMYDSNEFIVKAIENGANGYLLKDDDPSEIIIAVESVLSTGYYLNDRTSKILINQLMLNGAVVPQFKENQIEFSEIELKVIELICDEYSTPEIAEALMKGKRTIDGYRQEIMKKIGAKNVIGIVMYAFKNDLISID